MKPVPFIGAIVGGIVGALVWGAISHFTGYEVGYVAWAVGALVGFAAAALGGSGVVSGTACAVVTILSILGGKALAFQWAVDAQLKDEITPALFEAIRSDAKDLAAVNDPSDYPEFMVTHGYTRVKKATDVSKEAVAEFEAETAPLLRKVVAENMTYDDYLAFVKEDISLVEGVKASLGLLDIVFAALGIGTAFKLGLGSGQKSGDESDEGAGDGAPAA